MTTRRPSPEAQDWIEKLEATGGRLWARTVGNQGRLEALARLAVLAEPAAIPALLPWAFKRPAAVAESARAALLASYQRCPPGELLWLDREVRGQLSRMSFWGHRGGIPGPGSDALAEASSLPSPVGTLLTGLLSFHPDGRIRQAAVERLRNDGAGGDLPFLFLRLNDWVDEVRRVAEGRLRARLASVRGEEILPSLGLLRRVRAGSRVASPLLGEVDRTLAQRAAPEALLQALSADDRWAAREAFRVLREFSVVDFETTIRRTLASPDPVVRLRGLRLLPGPLTEETAIELLEPMRWDPFLPLRRERLLLLTGRLGVSLEASWEDYALDREAGVRYLARAAAAEAGADAEEFRALYRREIGEASGDRLRGAIYGLGEVGEAADLERLGDLEADIPAATRVALLRTRSRLDGAGSILVFQGALQDSSRRVVQAAAAALRPFAGRLSSETLWEWVTGSSSGATRRAALTLIAQQPKWRSLPLLLRATGLDDEKLAGQAVQALGAWLARDNQTFQQPETGQLERARAAFAEAEAILPEEWAKVLRFRLI